MKCQNYTLSVDDRSWPIGKYHSSGEVHFDQVDGGMCIQRWIDMVDMMSSSAVMGGWSPAITVQIKPLGCDMLEECHSSYASASGSCIWQGQG